MTSLAQWHEARFVENPDKIRVECVECCRAMWLPPSKARKYLRCGLQCSEIRKQKTKEAKRRTCLTCGKDFYPRRGHVQMGHGNFCSQKCNTAGRAALLKSLNKAVANRREKIKLGLIQVVKRGPDHPGWRGGPKAYQARMTASGKAAERLRNYRRRNPDKVREFKKRREGHTIGRLPRGTIKRIAGLQRWKCAICRSSIKRKYHMDHIVPLGLGGKHEPRNIQLLCGHCNVKKWMRDPITHMQSLGRLL